MMAADSAIKFDISALRHGFWQALVDGLEWGSIYALIAVGYTLVYGVLRLINFAHSEIFMFALFGQYIGLMMLGFSPNGNAYDQGIPLTILYLVLAGLIGAAVGGATAVGLERVAYRPLRRRNATPLVFLITAIGASFVLQEFVHFVLPKLTGNTLGGVNAQQRIQLVTPSTQFTIGSGNTPGVVTNVTFVIIGSALLLALVTDGFIRLTKFGRGIRAVAQDKDTATLMGVSRERVIMLTFLIGGLLAGAAALLYTLKPAGVGNVMYSAGFLLGLKAFCAAVLGGIGNLRGALLGGLLLGVVEALGQLLLGAEWKDPIAFVLLILVLMIRPTGILGESLGKARV